MSFADDLKNLDPNNPGLWPKPIQIVLFILLFIALLFAGWKFDITKKRDQLAALEKKETEKIEILKVRQRKAANLNALKEQMKGKQFKSIPLSNCSYQRVRSFPEKRVRTDRPFETMQLNTPLKPCNRTTPLYPTQP